MIEDLLYNSCRNVWRKCYFHTERAFCYELYHQMRIFLDNYNHTNFNQEHMSNAIISAEIHKTLNQNTVNTFPDIIIHNDNDNDNDDDTNQFLVMEVKNLKQSKDEISKDLIKLHQYMFNTELHFANGIILLYSNKNSQLKTFINNIHSIFDFTLVDNDNIDNNNNIIDIDININNNNTYVQFFNQSINHNKNLYFVFVTAARNDNTFNNVEIYKYVSNLGYILHV